MRDRARAPYVTLVAWAALAIVAAALADCHDPADRWLTLASDARGSMSIDPTHFRVIDGQPDAWVRVRFSTAKSADGIAFISYLEHARINCGDRTVASIALVYYNKAGDVVGNFGPVDLTPERFNETKPESVGDQLVSGTCKAWLDGRLQPQ
jgi:surface-adhesin protein E